MSFLIGGALLGAVKGVKRITDRRKGGKLPNGG